MREQFKGFIDPLPDPQTPEQAAAEIERAKALSYPKPDSPEEKERVAKFEEEFKKIEADYRENILPKVPVSPIETASRADIPVCPAVPVAPGKGAWTGPIPDQDSPDREAYLEALGDDEEPQLSEADRQRKADWDQRRKRTEERERLHARKKGA